MASLVEISQFARSAYGDPTPNGNQWKLLMSSEPNSAGYFGQAYIDDLNKEVIITNRGTRPTSIADLWSDLNLTVLTPTASQELAADFAIAVSAKLPTANYKIIETGHSLGGSNAQAALAKLVEAGVKNVSAVTFNSPGIGGYPHSSSGYIADNYYAQGDLIHRAGGVQLGIQHELPVGPSGADSASYLPFLALGPIGVYAFF